MTRLLNVSAFGIVIVAISNSIVSAALPPTVLWSDNFTGANGTGISTLPGWAAIPGFNTLTSYAIENALSPPVSARTYGMNNNAVYTLQTAVSGMNGKTSQWFHFKVHQANGNGTTLFDGVRVTTSGGCIMYFLIAERQTEAVLESPGASTSGLLGDKLSDNLWHEFDIKYNNLSGAQTITYLINSASVWTTSATSPGYITGVQFVQQGGAKPATGENHLIGEMAVGTSDSCTPPSAPTGIAANPSTVCSGSTSTLSVSNPGAGLTTDWFTGSCGGAAVAGGTGTNSVVVTVNATTTYYARTRRTSDNCMSTTCQQVTVTILNCDDGNACTNDSCASNACVHTNVTNGTACPDDGNPCTNDTCNNGTCTHPNVANGTACPDDGNVCTNDTCNNGTCTHPNGSNGIACEDGNPCTQGDTCQNGNCASGTPVVPCDTSNGFNADWTLFIRGGAYESEVRKLSKSETNVPCSDLGPFGTVADRTWPVTIATLHNNGDWQDSSLIKSICFSNSPVVGAHSPAGARLFGVYEVRNLDSDYDINGNLVHQEGQQETYSSAAFQIVELNSAGKRIRVMEVGLAANLYDGVHRGIGDPNGPNTDRNILTDPHWGANEEGWVLTRNNIGGVRIGTIRYNKAKDTLCVAAIVREHGSNDANLPPVGRVYEFALPDWQEVYYPSGPYAGQPIPQADPDLVKLVQIYEMPSSCNLNGVYTDGVTPYDCRIVQGGVWEGHSIEKDNGGVNEGEHQRPAITFDDNGTMYFTSIFCAATGIEFNGSYWTGENAWHGDVIKCDTRSHWAGKNVYTIPIHGADACNIAISAETEDSLTSEYPPLPTSLYASGTGLAVRRSPNQLLQMPEVTCNDTSAGPFEYLNIFDPAATRIDHPCELQRIESVHKKIAFSGLNWTDSTRTLYCDPGSNAFATYSYLDNRNLVLFTAGTGVGPLNNFAYLISSKQSNDAIVLASDINGVGGDITNHSIAGEINLSRADIPRSPLWAQYDQVGQRTYLGNELGACDAHQNFMYILDDDTVVGNVAYFLGYWKESNPNVVEPSCVGKTPFNNPDGSKPGQLNHTWDAASPPPAPPPNQVGACCQSGQTCTNLSQTACSAVNGLWRGNGTTCGNEPGLVHVACPGGACCKPCAACQKTLQESECTALGGTWAGEGTDCEQANVCASSCATPPVDGDCDGDVDGDDFAIFQRCFNPNAAIPVIPGINCACFDRAGSGGPGADGFIDHFDFDVFTNCVKGPNVATAPNCP